MSMAAPCANLREWNAATRSNIIPSLQDQGGRSVRDSWFRWIFRSRRQTALCLASLATFACLIYFWADLCLTFANLKLSQRDHHAAAKWVDRSQWFRRQTDARTCLIQVRIARRRGDFAEVENKLQQAIQLRAPRSEIQRENWIAMAQSQQFEGMQSHWTELLQDARDDGPEIARSYYAWAMLHHHLDLARKTLESWIQDFPQDPEPHFLLGQFHQAGPNWEQAEKAYRQSLALAPDRDDARLALALALQARLKTDEAIPLFQEYLQKHSEDLMAIQGLAQCFTSSGDVDHAMQLLRRASEQNPDDVSIQKAYGELLLSSGSPKEASSVLERAYRATPENANLANVLARAWKACGRKSDAEPLLAFVAESRPELEQLVVIEKELRASPNNLALRMKVAEITAKYVSRQDGIRWYQQVVRISPGYLPAHKALAELYQLVGDATLADHHSKLAQRGFP